MSGRVEDISGNSGGGMSRSTSSATQGGYSAGHGDDRGHNRSTSLGTFMGSVARRQAQQRGVSPDFGGRETLDQLFREGSPAPTASPAPAPREPSPSSNKPLPAPPSKAAASEQPQTAPPAAPVYLKPHIVSPTAQEFLLVTGTGTRGPGVGMFVNLEGDPTRSTLEFEKYPDEIVADGRGVDVEPTPANFEDEEEDFILASVGGWQPSPVT
jgi:vacuolar protein sorting-associated protein 3